MIGEILAVGVIALIIGTMIYREAKDNKDGAKWEEYHKLHRHCLPCPYKRRIQWT